MNSIASFRAYADHVRVLRSRFPATPLLVAVDTGRSVEWYDDGGREGCDVPGVAALLGVVCTRRKKNVEEVSEANPRMATVPSAAFQKYLGLLFRRGGYTVALLKPRHRDRYDDGDADPFFEVERIYSPGTALFIRGDGGDEIEDEGEEGGGGTGALMAFHTCAFGSGFASVDVDTGETCAWEVVAPRPGKRKEEEGEDRTVASFEAAVGRVRPAEILLAGSMSSFSPPLPACGRTYAVVHDRRVPHTSPFTRPAQHRVERILDQVFFSPVATRSRKTKTSTRGGSLLSAVERLDLERRPHAAAALVALLEFVESHDETAVRGLSRPVVKDWFDDDDDDDQRDGGVLLRMEERAARDLGLLRGDHLMDGGGGVKGSSLYDVLARGCITAAGRRYLSRRLLRPSARAATIHATQEEVQAFVDDADARERAKRDLKNMAAAADFDRVFRRVAAGVATPRHLRGLSTALSVACEGGALWAPEAASVIRDVLSSELRPPSPAPGDHPHRHPFVRGRHPDMDALEDRLERLRREFDEVARRVNADGGDVLVTVVVEPRTKFQVMLQGRTEELDAFVVEGGKKKRRKTTFTKTYGRKEREEFEVFPSSAHTAILYHPSFARRNAEISEAWERLRDLTVSRMTAFLRQTARDLEAEMRIVAHRVAHVDFLVCAATLAIERNYVRPRILPRSEEGLDIVKAERLRHPVLELSAHDRAVAHVPHDIGLGQLLLFGVNGAGKSCLVSGLGMCVVMAQAGMWVPASAFQMVPVRRLYTRMGNGGGGAGAEGRSSFVRDMLGLRAVLRGTSADDSGASLVLADEACVGTDDESALAILAATVAHLRRTGSPFLMATHVHRVVEALPELRDVACAHLNVFLREDGALVYDRRLLPGRGMHTYGVEVCEALDMDPAFLGDARRVRDSSVSTQRT